MLKCKEHSHSVKDGSYPPLCVLKGPKQICLKKGRMRNTLSKLTEKNMYISMIDELLSRISKCK